MDIWKSIAGMLDVELTSAEPEMAFNSINAAGIEIFQMRQVNELTCCFRIFRHDYSKLSTLCERRGETLRITKKTGMYWTVKAIRNRPVMLIGTVLLLCFVLFLPTRVLFIRVDGNAQIPSRKILDAAESCGIVFGASRREVRSEKVKNALLCAVPELQWAGVNTSGCVATISVRERTDQEAHEEEREVTNIVAARDGYILSGTVTRGNAVFQVGQTVTAGQILISGYTDCGICIRATRSEGEILAQTKREIDVVAPDNYIQRGSILDVKKKISLLIRKKRINLWKDSGISDGSCGRMYEEYYVTLPGGFQLPAALCVETYLSYDTQPVVVTPENAKDGLEHFADTYLTKQMVAGEICDRFCSITQEDGVYRLKGCYVCTEMIGREQGEQIGAANGKSN